MPMYKCGKTAPRPEDLTHLTYYQSPGPPSWDPLHDCSVLHRTTIMAFQLRAPYHIICIRQFLGNNSHNLPPSPSQSSIKICISVRSQYDSKV